MVDKTLYLHIGLAKTGTSFIQSSLAYNRKWLKQNGVCYPVLSEKRGSIYGEVDTSNANILAKLLLPETREKGFDNVKAWQRFEEVLQHSFKRLILSSEKLSGGMFSAKLDVEEANKFYFLCQRYGFDVRIIVFFRSYLEHAFSAWNQCIKGRGFNKSFDYFCKTYNRGLFQRCENYANVFEKNRIICFNYDTKRKILLETFSDLLSVPYIKPCPAQEVNRSLSQLEISKMLYLNDLSSNYPSADKKRIGKTISDLMCEVDAEKTNREIVLSREAWEIFQKNHEDDLKKVNKYYMRDDPVQMSLQKPKFEKKFLPSLNQAEKQVLHAIQANLSGIKDAPVPNKGMVAEINKASIYILSSMVYRKQNDLESALWAARKAVELSQNQLRAYNELFSVYEARGEENKAKDVAKKIQSLWPGFNNSLSPAVKPDKSKTIYLNIGLPKTGTSSIQQFFELNRVLLQDNGFLYPQTGIAKGSGHAGIAEAVKNNNKQVLKYIKKELNSSKCDKFVISSENFFAFEEAAIKRLYRQLHRYRTYVIVYLRRQDARIESGYLQVLRDAEFRFNGSIEDYISFLFNNQRRIDYYELLKPWGSVFGKDSVIVKVYEEETATNNLIPGFLATCGIVPDERYKYINRYANPPYKPGINRILRLINKIPISKKIHSKITGILNFFSTRLIGFGTMSEHKLLSDEKRNEILSYFEESNKKVASEYLDRHGTSLFN